MIKKIFANIINLNKELTYNCQKDIDTYFNIDFGFLEGNIKLKDKILNYSGNIYFIKYDPLNKEEFEKKIINFFSNSEKGILIIFMFFGILSEKLINFFKNNKNIYLFIFHECWGGISEIKYHINLKLHNFFPLPVSTRLEEFKIGKLNKNPNKNIFLDIGNRSTNFSLIKSIIESNKDLNFYIPNRSFFNITNNVNKYFFLLDFKYKNCNVIKSFGQFTQDYKKAYDKCDTVIILIDDGNFYNMIGGSRLADAIYANKYIITTKNYVNNIFLVKNNKNAICLINKLKYINEAINKIKLGLYKNDINYFNNIRNIITSNGKIEYIFGGLFLKNKFKKFNTNKILKQTEKYDFKIGTIYHKKLLNGFEKGVKGYIIKTDNENEYRDFFNKITLSKNTLNIYKEVFKKFGINKNIIIDGFKLISISKSKIKNDFFIFSFSNYEKDSYNIVVTKEIQKNYTKKLGNYYIYIVGESQNSKKLIHIFCELIFKNLTKKILHISGTKHILISDLLDYRREDILVIGNDFEKIKNSLNKIDVIFFHFIKDLDLKKIIKIIPKEIKIGLFVHDFYPFCSRGNLSLEGKKCDIIDVKKCNCNLKKFLDFLDYKIFFEKLDFVIAQDEFSREYFIKIRDFYKFSFKVKYIKQLIIENKNKIDFKKNSANFRLGFVGIPSEIKGFGTIIKLLQKLDNDFLQKNKIEFNFYSLFFENPKISVFTKEYKGGYVKHIFNQTDRKEIFSNIDCLLIPSFWNENGPMTLYEAFVNKIPVIISDQESLKEKVIDRVDSYIFKTGDLTDLLKGILWMKNNYEKIILNNEGFKYNNIENFNLDLIEFLNE